MKRLITISTMIAMSTVLTMSGTAMGYSAGQFCKKSAIGTSTTADNGRTIVCTMNGSRARWKYASSATPTPTPTVPPTVSTPNNGEPTMSTPVTTVPPRTNKPPRTKKGRYNRKTVRIVRVVDGDTVKAKELRTGKLWTVRIIGIDTPETRKPGVKVECGGRQATASMKRLANKKRGVLIADHSQDYVDRYGRILGYLKVGKRDVGRTLVNQGWATTYVYRNKPFNRYRMYKKSENRAEAAGKGVYGICNGDFHSEQ